jgi:hypothetical protein
MAKGLTSWDGVCDSRAYPSELWGLGGPKRWQDEWGPGTLGRCRAARAAGAVGPGGEHAGLLARG